MADVAALSGPAARMGLVLLLAGGQPLRLSEAGAAAGITRRNTRTDAAIELERLGLARRQPRGRTVLLVPSESCLVVSRPTEDEGRGREGMEIDKDRNDTRIPIYLSIYRHASENAGGDSAEAAALRVPSDQAVTYAADSAADDMRQKVQHVSGYASESAAYQNGHAADSAAYPEHASVSAAYPPQPSAVSAAYPDDDAEDDEDDLLLPVELADAMERGEPTNQRNSPYIRRRNAQVAALQALWRGTFHASTAPTRESIVALLRLTGDSALVVAEMMQDVGERIAGGLKVQSLYGYLRKTIENRMREEKTRPAPTPSRPNRVAREDDPIELSEPSAEFLAELARAKKTAAALWGDE